MLALIGNLDVLEVVLIFTVAIIVFGKNLPQVALRGAGYLMKVRKEVTRMWREAGLEEELRKVRRDLENEVPRHIPSAEELIQHAEHAEQEESAEAVMPEDVGALAPIDPLSREALAGEPGEETADGSEVGPGEEDSFHDPTLMPRTEPTGEEYADDPSAGGADENEVGPGEEDSLLDPTPMPRTEPTGEEHADDPSAGGADEDAGKESA